LDYRTNELELAAFLKARGHKLIGTQPDGRLIRFAFPESASADADGYFAGMEVSARDLFEAHRHLRALIQQIKQHLNNQNGKNTNEHIFARN